MLCRIDNLSLNKNPHNLKIFYILCGSNNPRTLDELPFCIRFNTLKINPTPKNNKVIHRQIMNRL